MKHRSAHRHAQPAAPAFTLVELILVMVVVALMAAIAAPQLSNIGNTRGAVAARMIARDLTYARQRAMSTGTRVWVVFSPGTNSYSVLAEDPANPGRMNASTITDPSGTGRPFVQYLNVDDLVGVTMTNATFDSGVEIGFDWLGKPYTNSTTLLNADGKVILSPGDITVKVFPATGLTKLGL